MTAITKALAIGLILSAGISVSSGGMISDFALFTGSGGNSTDLHIGQNVTIYGLAGSNGNIDTSSGSVFWSGLRAGGSLNPGGIAGQNATIGGPGSLAEAIVNGDFNFNGDTYGTVYAGGNAAMGSNSSLLKVGISGGDLYAIGDVDLGGGNSLVQGNVYAGGAVSGSGTVRGATIQHTPPPPAAMKSFGLVAMPAATVFSAGGTDVSVGSGNTANLALAPGSYRDLSAGSNATLTLSSGDYYFNSLDAGSGLDLKLDLSSGGSVNIYVTGDVSFGSNLTVLAKGATGGFTDVADIADHSLGSLAYLETHSQFKLGSGGEWLGTVYAATDVSGSKTELSIGQNARIWGALYSADQLDLASGTRMNYVQPGQVPEPCLMSLLLAGALLVRGRRVRACKTV